LPVGGAVHWKRDLGNEAGSMEIIRYKAAGNEKKRGIVEASNLTGSKSDQSRKVSWIGKAQKVTCIQPASGPDLGSDDN